MGKSSANWERNSSGITLESVIRSRFSRFTELKAALHASGPAVLPQEGRDTAHIKPADEWPWHWDVQSVTSAKATREGFPICPLSAAPPAGTYLGGLFLLISKGALRLSLSSPGRTALFAHAVVLARDVTVSHQATGFPLLPAMGRGVALGARVGLQEERQARSQTMPRKTW